jgi:hypothetical protein
MDADFETVLLQASEREAFERQRVREQQLAVFEATQEASTAAACNAEDEVKRLRDEHIRELAQMKASLQAKKLEKERELQERLRRKKQQKENEMTNKVSVRAESA